MDMKGLTMESIQKEGKVQEVAPGTVQISPERQQLIGVKIGTVEMKPLEKVIRTVGRVDYDEKRIVTVSPKIGGWIEDLYIDFTGRFVRQGEPLLTIYSPELVSTQEEYLIALQAKKELTKSPFPKWLEVEIPWQNLPNAVLNSGTSATIRSRPWRRAASRKRRSPFIPPSVDLSLKNAYKGMSVMPGMALFKLADLSVVWLIADIYEYELPFVRLEQQASIQLSYLPGETFTGRAIYIYPSLIPETELLKYDSNSPILMGN